jgi:CRISPR-associated protein Cas2
MAGQRQLHVFCYDVRADSVRRRVSDALEEVAVRVQDSVFEARMTQAAAERIGRQVGAMLQKGDSLRMYVVPPGMVPACRQWGRGPAIEESDFHLL